MSDSLADLLKISLLPWQFSADGLVCLLEKVINQRIKVTSAPSLCLTPACSCAGGYELPVFFTKFAGYLATDVPPRSIPRQLLRISCLLCAEVRLLLQRTLKHAQEYASPAACKPSLEKFGTHLRSMTCSVSHILLQVIAQTDESVHGRSACAPLFSELLLLAQLLQTCLLAPVVASSYSSHLKLVLPPSIESSLSRDIVPSMTLPPRFSVLLRERCQLNLQCAFMPRVDNTDVLHMLFSVARVLQLFSSPSISLFAQSRVSALVANPNVQPVSHAPSPDDACVRFLRDTCQRACDATWGGGISATELHLFAVCMLPVFVVWRDGASCGAKEFTMKAAVYSDLITRCIALADTCTRFSMGSSHSSAVYSSAAIAFFRALGPMVGALPSLNSQSVAPCWDVAAYSSAPTSSDCDSSIASPHLINAESAAFLSNLERWRGDACAHLAADCRGQPLLFSENLKNFLSFWFLWGTGGGLIGLVKRHSLILSSSEHFADNLHRTLHFCANESHPSSAQPGMEYCINLLTSANVSDDNFYCGGAFSALFDGVAGYFAHSLRDLDFVRSLNESLVTSDGEPHASPRINLRLNHILATIQSCHESAIEQLSPAAASAFVVALCRAEGTQRKTVMLLPPLSPTDRFTCSVGLKRIWNHIFAAFQQSRHHKTTLLVLRLLSCIVDHDCFYSGSVFDGVKDINLLQTASLAHNIIFTAPLDHSIPDSLVSIVSVSSMLIELCTACSHSSWDPRDTDPVVYRMYAFCVLANKALACAIRRTDCADVSSIRLSALWTDDTIFDADTWRPHSIYQFFCGQLMPFLLQYSIKICSCDARETLSFQLEDWCHVMLMLLSHVNLIRRCPPCPSEIQLLFTGIFPLLCLLSERCSPQSQLHRLVDLLNVSLQPALTSATSKILSRRPLPHVANGFFRCVHKKMFSLCRANLQTSHVSCQRVTLEFLEHYFRSFDMAMSQHCSASSRLIFSYWNDSAQQVPLRNKTFHVRFHVQVETWPATLTHAFEIDFLDWSDHMCRFCIDGLQDIFALLVESSAAKQSIQMRDAVVDSISSLLTFAAQNLLIHVVDTSITHTKISHAESIFLNTCEFLVHQISAAEATGLAVLRRVLVQNTSIFSASSSRILGPPVFLEGWAFSATHYLPRSDELVFSQMQNAVAFEDHPVFDKDLEMHSLFVLPSNGKKVESSTLVSDAIRMFLRDHATALLLLISNGLLLQSRIYCHAPKNCKPSCLQWLRWRAAMPQSDDSTSASVAQDILFLLPDPDTFFTTNLRPSVNYRSLKNELHNCSKSQSGFESAMISIVDSSFYTSSSLALMNHCIDGKFTPFQSAYITALSLPSELVAKSFSFLLFLLGRPGQRINMSNAAVLDGLFPKMHTVNDKFRSHMENLIKLLLYTSDFENSQNNTGSSAESADQRQSVFTPKSGSSEKVSLLVDFLSCSPCLTPILHDLSALEFLIFRPPHADFDSLQVNFHCLGFLKDLLHRSAQQRLNTGYQFCAVVKEVLNFADTANTSLADLGNWTDAIGSVFGPVKFMWLVNSRLVIYLQRHMARCLGCFRSLLSEIDCVSLPLNISTLCGMFGSFFRLLCLIVHWRLNIKSEDALITCIAFINCITQQSTLFRYHTTFVTSEKMRNCQVEEELLVPESIRAVTHALSLLCANRAVAVSEVVPSLLKLLGACEGGGCRRLSDSVLSTISKVCARAVGVKIGVAPDHLTQELTGVVEFNLKPSHDVLMNIQGFIIAICIGMPHVSTRSVALLSLLKDILPLCPILALSDLKNITAVCADAMRVDSGDSDSLFIFESPRLFAWKAAAELARFLLQSIRSSDQDFTSAETDFIPNIVTLAVQSIGKFLRFQLLESRSHSAILSQCCNAGVELVYSILHASAVSTVSEATSVILNACADLLKLARNTDLSCLNSRDKTFRNFLRRHWVGIENIGNTCYAASVLQQLISIPCFVFSIFDSSLGPLSSSHSQALLPLIQSVATEMLGLSNNQLQLLQPHSLYSRCMLSGSSVLQIADTTAQSQDAAEFFTAFMNQLNAETSTDVCVDFMIASSPRLCAASLPVISSSISERFAVSVTETFNWPACGCNRIQSEDSLFLTGAGLMTQDSSGKSFSSIDAALLSHFSSQNLQRCCSCGTEQASPCTATKRITRVSEILLVQLRCDTADGTCSKVFEQPSFPLVFDIRHVAETIGDTEYELHGVVLHHGLSMSTGHYTSLVRDEAAGDLIWGLHLNDSRVPEPISHSAIREVSSLEGRRVDLLSSNLVYSGKPYLLVYTRRHHQHFHPSRVLLSDAFFDICKILATLCSNIKTSSSESVKLDILLFCIHAAAACVRLGYPTLRRLQSLFADIVGDIDSESMNALVSDLLSAASATEPAVLVNSMIPFYLMTRTEFRLSELHSAFLHQPSSELSARDFEPARLGPAVFVSLVSAAHSISLGLDFGRFFFAEVAKCMSHVAAVSSGRSSTDGAIHLDMPLNSAVFAFFQVQPARIVSAVRAFLAALMLFNRMLEPLSRGSTTAWLTGLSDRAGVELVCQHLEMLGVIDSLINVVQASSDAPGSKRLRDEDAGGSSATTVWERIVQICSGFTGVSAPLAEWL